MARRFPFADYWTEQEEALLLSMHVDCDDLGKLLPGRSIKACQHRLRRNGIVKFRIRPWSGTEIGLLRKLYPKATRAELRAAFPHRTYKAIATMARRRGYQRPLPTFRLSGNALIDEVKLRARQDGLTMRELDLVANSKAYFSGSSSRGHFNATALKKAIKALGGKLVIAWDE